MIRTELLWCGSAPSLPATDPTVVWAVPLQAAALGGTMKFVYLNSFYFDFLGLVFYTGLWGVGAAMVASGCLF